MNLGDGEGMPTPQGRVASLVIVEFLDFANVLQPQVTRNTPTVGQTWLHWLTAGREMDTVGNRGPLQQEGHRKDSLLGFVFGDLGDGLRKQSFALD